MSYNFLIKNNNAESTLSGNLSSGATSLTVTSASAFPLTGNFLCTIWNKTLYPDPTDDINKEIVKVTGVSGNIFTIVRGQESTSDNSHISGDAIEMLMTSGHFTELEDEINNKLDIGTTTASISDSLDKRYVTDADLVIISNAITSETDPIFSTWQSSYDHHSNWDTAYSWGNHAGLYEPTLTKGNLTETTSSVLTISGGTNAIIGSGLTIQVKQASTSLSGYLSSTDWNTFNNKQNAGTYVTSITVASSNGFAGSSSGGATPALTISTSIAGLLKGNGTAISAASAGSDYEVPLTFSTGLTRTINTVTVNTTQNITKLSNLTSNGYIKTSGGDGTLGIQTVPIPVADGGTNAITASITSFNNITGYTASGATGTTSSNIVFSASPTFTGSPLAPTQSANDNSTKLATTAYVDNALLEQNYKEAVKYASTAALPSIVYSNGSSGVGATLTGVALAAISLDSSSPSVNDRVLIKNQTSTFQNGIYIVTATGSGVAVFVLTRVSDFDEAADIKTGDAVFVTSGSTQSLTTWSYTGIDSPTMGTTAITFAQVAGQGSFTASNGISVSGTVISGINALADGSTKGVATYNATNFTTSVAGVVNTIQNIHTGATPSFAGLTLGSLTVTRITYAGTSGLLQDSANLTYSGTRLSPNYITLAAGTASAGTAPLIFVSGTSLTSALAGAMEFTTDDLFFTITTGTARKRLLMADAVGGLTTGKLPQVTTNGRLIDSSSTGFVKVTSGTISYDTNTYLTASTSSSKTLVLSAFGVSSITSGAGFTIQELSSNKQNIASLDFDTTTQEYAEWTTVMPDNWDGGTFTATFYWFANSTSTNGVRWAIQARSYGDAETLDQAWGTAQEVTDNNGSTAKQLRISSATSAVTCSGTPAAGELVQFRVYRNVGHANDDLAVDAQLLEVKIKYTSNAYSE